MSAAAAMSAGPGGTDIARWGMCFAAAVALHAGLAAFLVSERPPPSSGAADLPAVVMIDMASAAPAAEPMAQSEPAETEPPAPAQHPLPLPAAKAAVTLPAPPKPVRPKPAPKAAPRPKPPEKAVERPPPKPARAAPARAEPREARRPPAEPAGARRTALLPASPAPSSAKPAAAAASAASWRSQLVVYLQGNLRYPPGSRGGGTASVSFSMNRAGRVLSASLASSAGTPELDAAALDLFRRGTLPAPPGDVPGATFSFTIPIRFSAR